MSTWFLFCFANNIKGYNMMDDVTKSFFAGLMITVKRFGGDWEKTIQQIVNRRTPARDELMRQIAKLLISYDPNATVVDREIRQTVEEVYGNFVPIDLYYYRSGCMLDRLDPQMTKEVANQFFTEKPPLATDGTYTVNLERGTFAFRGEILIRVHRPQIILYEMKLGRWIYYLCQVGKTGGPKTIQFPHS